MSQSAPSAEDTQTTAGVVAPPPLLALIALAIGVTASRFAPLGLLISIDPLIRYLGGGVLVVIAIGLELAASVRFSRAGTPKAPWKPTRALATGGVYTIMRNPMYVGFILLEIGIAIIGGFDWLIPATLMLALILHYGVVLREERYLLGLFGEEYAAFMRAVSRYGVPGL